MSPADDSPHGNEVVVVHLSEQQLEEIIERAAVKAARAAAAETLDEAKKQFVYQVGIGVLRRVAWVLGMGVLILGVWLATSKLEVPK